MSEPAIRVSSLYKSYPSGERRLEVLRGLSLRVEKGEMVAIVGESGAGKSTLLHLLGGLDHPDEGEILLAGLAISALTPTARAAWRNQRVGYVFQFHHLLPEFTAEENVSMPCLIAGDSQRAARHKARALLSELGLQDRATHRPAQLSGGEQQRVAVARALVVEPTLLLADEPTGNLDAKTGDAVFARIAEAVAKRGTTTVLVTHSQRLARRCHQIRVMEDGILRSLEKSQFGHDLETPAVQM